MSERWRVGGSKFSSLPYCHQWSNIAVTLVLLAVWLLPVSLAADDVPSHYSYQVIHRYPHDAAAFTEGLAIAGDMLYESTGLNGASSLRQVDLATGQTLARLDLPTAYFGEGMTLFEGSLYQLTWQSHIGFIYDLACFCQRGTFSYDGEGWGLTHDADNLIMSDGTDRIRFLDPHTFAVVRTISVRDSDRDTPLTNINELEYVNGEIYANIWQTDRIARINPATGALLGWIDLAGLLPAGDRAPGTDVLNGIAYDAATNRLFVTGKNWPTLFQIALVNTAAPLARAA